MKKQIFIFALLLSLISNHLEAAKPALTLADPAITTSSLVAGTAFLGTLFHSAEWPTDNKNRPSIWTSLGEPLCIPGRDTLQLTSIGLGLLTTGLLFPATRPALTNVGTFMATCLAGQSFFSTNNNADSVNIQTTVKYTLGAIFLFGLLNQPSR